MLTQHLFKITLSSRNSKPLPVSVTSWLVCRPLARPREAQACGGQSAAWPGHLHPVPVRASKGEGTSERLGKLKNDNQIDIS